MLWQRTPETGSIRSCKYLNKIGRSRVNHLTYKCRFNERNRNLCSRLIRVKASVDNKPTQKLNESTLKAKSMLTRSVIKSDINNKNGILLDRIFKIFAR